MKRNYTLENINEVAQEVIRECKTKIILLNGEMGAGKTTLSKEIFKELGVVENTTSPTFSLVNEYKTKENEIVYHFDFYRIEEIEEVLDIGIEEYIESNRWCVIEWADKIEELLPNEYDRIDIEIISNFERKLQLKK